SIAAGHLREASLAAAVKRRKLGRLAALDADPISLDKVRRDYGHYGVETVAAHLRRLLTGQLQLGTFDLVYSTGLLDYLNDSAAARLVTVMFDMLRPGGRMVVANFLPGVRDTGYMEAFMDWQLIYRTRRDMVGLTLDVPEDQIRELTLFAEEHRNIIFLQVTKR
ncbi:MAG: class I SAM-dependent methyltransferase, partial [Planctomycetaceae bacterium]